MKQPIRKNAAGANTMRPLATYQPPSVVSGRTVKPKSLPLPKSSRMKPTTIRTTE
jgi:hypothetical protein